MRLTVTPNSAGDIVRHNGVDWLFWQLAPHFASTAFTRLTSNRARLERGYYVPEMVW